MCIALKVCLSFQGPAAAVALKSSQTVQLCIVVSPPICGHQNIFSGHTLMWSCCLVPSQTKRASGVAEGRQ
jgi:hypothetical protein